MATRYFATSHPTSSATPEEVEVQRLDDRRFAVTFRGRRREVDTQPTRGTALSLIVEGHSHLAEIERSNEITRISLEGAVHTLTLLDERSLQLRSTQAGGGVAGKQVVRTPMPGKVVRLLVSLGDEVAEGQGLVVVEAMKMENELKSPKAGRVCAIQVQEGAAVEGNAPLMAVE